MRNKILILLVIIAIQLVLNESVPKCRFFLRLPKVPWKLGPRSNRCWNMKNRPQDAYCQTIFEFPPNRTCAKPIEEYSNCYDRAETLRLGLPHLCSETSECTTWYPKVDYRGKLYYFCCCKGDMCNVNIAPPVTVFPRPPERDEITETK